ncbi:uncharacterized protein LOC142772144 isoform X2 [Rhipicephalus microplus]|uniref:uncharacterized protein LOC142772144 isoform X2 n=1 Tax=Rhipicephalus microplus TaxID=6941 RepID=UPI003F6CA106
MNALQAHFEPNNYKENRVDGWKKLKPNAVPTLVSFRPLPKERRPPKERTVPAPSGGETSKSAPGLRQSPATVEIPREEAPLSHAVHEPSLEGMSRYGHDATELSDAAVKLSANSSYSHSGEANDAAIETSNGTGETSNATAESAEQKKNADLTRKYTEL